MKKELLDNNLKELFEELNKKQKENLEYVKSQIENIVDHNIRDENMIERVFDQLLDLAYCFKEDIKDIYNNFLNYYKTINLEASDDYKKFYLEIIAELNEENSIQQFRINE